VVCQRIRVRPLSVEPLAWQLGPSGRIRGCGCASCVVIVAALNAGLVQPHLLLGALHPSHTSPLLPTALATVPPLSSHSRQRQESMRVLVVLVGVQLKRSLYPTPTARGVERFHCGSSRRVIIRFQLLTALVAIHSGNKIGFSLTWV